MTSSVTEAPYEIQYTYGPDNQRIKSVLKNNGSTIKTKYYSIGYEKEIAGTTERQIHYISSPYGLVAVLIKQGDTTSTYYTETDHLGSIIGLLNSDGTYEEQYSYDAWGRRRNHVDWTYTNVPVPTLIDRGYTGHEHLDLFGLINLNGRMYDPVLGRFAGVDPIIQSPDNSQSFNGYSYCLNNPTKYTDPDGYKYRPYSYDIFFQSNYVESWEQLQDDFGSMHNYVVNQGDDDKNKSKGSENSDSKPKYKITYIWIIGIQVPVILPITMPIIQVAEKQNFTGFWGGLRFILTGGNIGGYHYNMEGNVVGFAPITGIAPTPGFAKGVKIIQYGGHTLENGTLKILNITKEEGKIGIESLKEAHGLPPDFHGNIGIDGSFWSKAGKYIDNILDYIY
jgi:RHS repeat-associated protein